MSALPVSTPYDVKKPYSGGRCKGLFVGINYEGSDAELNGCINDVSTLLDLLEHMNFPLQETVILVDDVRFPGCSGMPTHDNIIKAMHWLTKDAVAGDILFVHYSGHGTQITAEMNGDGAAEEEVDGKDEALVPVDYNDSGLITDDVVFQYLCRPLPEGVRLTALLDCCHSGTLMDLPFVYTADPNAPSSYAPSTANQCCGDIIMISGCQDSQTSADAVGANFLTPAEHPGQAGGACTNALQDTILKNEDGKLTYSQVLDRMRQALTSRSFSQVPQLSCSKPIDVDRIFDFKGLLGSKPVHEIPNVTVEIEQAIDEANYDSEADEPEPMVFTTNDNNEAVADAAQFIPPPPTPQAAPEPDFDFEPADQESHIQCKPSEWKKHEDAQGSHGFGISHYRKKHGERKGRRGQGYGVGRIRYDQVGNGSYGKNRRGNRRAQGRGGRQTNVGGRRRRRGGGGGGRGRRGGRGGGGGGGGGGGRHGNVVAVQQPDEGGRRGGGRGARGYKKAGSMYKRIGTYTIPTDDESLREIFETFDADGNGAINRGEFVAAMVAFEAEMGVFVNPQSMMKKFERYDRNGDGHLTYPEFEIFMLNRAAQ